MARKIGAGRTRKRSWRSSSIKKSERGSDILRGDRRKRVGKRRRFFGRKDCGREREAYLEKQAEMDFSVLCRRFSYSQRFSAAAIKEAKALQDSWAERREDYLRGREDCRGEFIVTIDPDTAKDFDDAVCLAPIFSGAGAKTGYRLSVHIADVSVWVKPGSNLDKVAYHQGNSVYLLDETLPMLPEEISSELASLREGEERLVFSCFIELDLRGEILSFEFKKAFIRINNRLTYRQVEAVLEKQISLGGRLDTMLFLMQELSEVLYRKRVGSGALDLDFLEQDIYISDHELDRVEARSRLGSERIIEEFMLLANSCAALMMEREGGGHGLFRVHGGPSEDKKADFLKRMEYRGYIIGEEGSENPLEAGGGVANRFQIFLERLKGAGELASAKRDERVDTSVLKRLERDCVSYSFLRMMQQAEYSGVNYGHYGLAFGHYTHFTSPIRRYSDLAVHRILFSLLEGGQVYSRGELQEIAEKTSFHERRAVLAEREYKKVKLIRYLMKRKDEVFLCFVREAIPRGLFVSGVSTFVEGFLPAGALGEGIFYEDSYGEFINERGESCFYVGQVLELQLLKLDLDRFFIDFKLYPGFTDRGKRV